MVTPYGARLQLGRDREHMPLLHGRFAVPGSFIVCPPDSFGGSVVGIPIDTGATTHVAGACWETRLNPLPGVGISARTVVGGVFTSIERGLLVLDLRVGASPTPSALDYALTGPSYPATLVPGRHAKARLPAADVGEFCGEPFDFNDAPDLGDPGDPVVGLVYFATGT